MTKLRIWRWATAALCVALAVSKALDWSHLATSHKQVAVLEVALAVLLALGWMSSIARLGVVLLGVGFSVATLSDGPRAACHCFGAHEAPFEVRLGIAVALLALGGYGFLLGPQPANKQDAVVTCSNGNGGSDRSLACSRDS